MRIVKNNERDRWLGMPPVLGMGSGGGEGRAEVVRPSLASDVIWFAAGTLCTKDSKPLRDRKTVIERDNFFLPHYLFV